MNTICIKSIRTNIHVDIIHANNGYVKHINRKQFRYIKQLQNGLIMFIFHSGGTVLSIFPAFCYNRILGSFTKEGPWKKERVS